MSGEPNVSFTVAINGQQLPVMSARQPSMKFMALCIRLSHNFARSQKYHIVLLMALVMGGCPME